MICAESNKTTCLVGDFRTSKIRTMTITHDTVIDYKWTLNKDGLLELDGTNHCLYYPAHQGTTSMYLKPCDSLPHTTVIFAYNTGDFESIAAPKEYLFDYSIADLDTNLVHLHGLVDLHPKSGDRSTKEWNYNIMTHDTTSLDSAYCMGTPVIKIPPVSEMSCHFRHKQNSSFIIVGGAHTFWQRWEATAITCFLPSIVKVNPSNFIPSVVIDGRNIRAKRPLDTLQPYHHPKHLFCMCLTIWNHWEYLLEFIKYHTDVHGLGHTIILAQDQETVDAVRWLSVFYSIEVVYWPHLATQPSMMAYASVLGKNKCEWMGQWDVDEFLLLGKDQNLTSLLHSNPSVGSYEFFRKTIQMNHGTVVLRTLPGGVVRNYMCLTGRYDNMKSVIRLSAMHSSFINVIHQFCPRLGFVVERRTDDFFMHYRTQSWEIYRSRYVRNVSNIKFRGTFESFPIKTPDVM